MRGAIPPLPNTLSWHGAQLKHRDNSTFTFTFTLTYSRYANVQLHYTELSIGAGIAQWYSVGLRYG
jgi:hypothetical protein